MATRPWLLLPFCQHPLALDLISVGQAWPVGADDALVGSHHAFQSLPIVPVVRSTCSSSLRCHIAIHVWPFPLPSAITHTMRQVNFVLS